MTLQRTGGLAALTCAATYLVGFALLVTVLAPLGYGTNAIDAEAVVAFIGERASLLIGWNSTIYIVNALALAVLVVALHDRLKTDAPAWAEVTRAFGLIWAALVLGAGMIANVAVERAATLGATDPAGAAELWEVLHAVELGLGGGNEIAGGVWILCVSIAGRTLGHLARGIGIVAGAAGLATLVPALGDTAGAVFGLGAIAWFVASAVALLRAR
ncbi:hypothetical protein N8I71_07990 [Roseibacterium sp. SDUM158016]|uniref:hypothetical protein n=1 Tax=Roseicyclus sediminis TaxID=2980997 RepID=UPI0021D1B797|nr:hypothetical protein [Roseibacterium sp. SDUM158016]MCU4652769.1 hypothetical protein [Roseibacterium sp. SDUM158016]